MRRQRDMFQIRELNKTPEKTKNKMKQRQLIYLIKSSKQISNKMFSLNLGIEQRIMVKTSTHN